MGPGHVFENAHAVVAVCKHLAEAPDSDLNSALVQKMAAAAHTAHELVAELIA